MSDWPSNLDVAPLLVWPGQQTPEYRRTHSPYRATFKTTVADLNRELAAMAAARPTLQVDIPSSHFRLDGKPRADAKPRSPGVVLSFSRLARTPRFTSVAAARTFLARMAAGEGLTGPHPDEALHRAAVKATHPDAGGNDEDFRRVEEAWGVIARPNTYRFAKDGYYTWQENLRAIVLTIGALRAVERYGVVQGDEHFAGFKQLTA